MTTLEIADNVVNSINSSVVITELRDLVGKNVWILQSRIYIWENRGPPVRGSIMSVGLDIHVDKSTSATKPIATKNNVWLHIKLAEDDAPTDLSIGDVFFSEEEAIAAEVVRT